MRSSNLTAQLTLLLDRPGFSYLVKDDAMCLIPSTSIRSQLGEVLTPGTVITTDGRQLQAVFHIDTGETGGLKTSWVHIDGTWLLEDHLDKAVSERHPSIPVPHLSD